MHYKTQLAYKWEKKTNGFGQKSDGSVFYQGSLDISGNQVRVYRKGSGAFILFGLIGDAISMGKKMFSFTFEEVVSYSVAEKTGRGDAIMTLNFKNGNLLRFSLTDDLSRVVPPMLKNVQKIEA